MFSKAPCIFFQNLFLIEIALSLTYFTVYLMFFFLILFSVVTGITALLCLLRQREDVVRVLNHHFIELSFYEYLHFIGPIRDEELIHE